MSALSNARWTALAQGFRVGIQLLSLFVLSRLLSPRDYGLVAMAAVVTNLAGIVRDMGTAAAVIQKRDLDEETILSAFWFSVLIGSALGGLLALGAPLVARGFKTPELTPLLLWLSVSFPLGSFGSVHQALLERDSRFALVARIEIVSGLAGLAVAIGLALRGAGPYSLIAQTLTFTLLSSIQLWVAAKWTPRWRLRLRELQTLWRFSGHLVAFNVINYFGRNADSIIIGRVLGPVALGPYSLAYRIMLFPLQNITAVSARALFPVMSRNQDAVHEIGTLYLRVLGMIAAVTAPMMCGLFVLRALFVSVVLGDKWAAVAPLLAVLAPTGFIQSIVSTTGAVFMARGRTDALFYLSCFSVGLQLIGFLVGIHWGVLGLATGYFIAHALSGLFTLRFVLGLVGQPLSSLFKGISRSIGLALLMGVSLAVAQHYLAFSDLAPDIRLAVLVVAGSVIYVATSYSINKPVLRDFLRLVSERRARPQGQTP